MRNPFAVALRSFRGPGAVEVRAIEGVPWDVGGSGYNSTDSVTEKRARRLSPVFAAHRHLADGIGTLPLKAYEKRGNARQPMRELPLLFQFLADEGTLTDWVTQAVLGMAGSGSAAGLITSRDAFGFPTAVMWRPACEWSVDDTIIGRPQWYWDGRKIDRSEIVHIPWLTVPGRTWGLSPLEAFALTVNTGLSAQQYGNDWYAAGGVPPGTFKNSVKKVDQTEATVIKSRLVQAIKTREPIVYGSDWDYSPVTIAPEQAQMVESLRLSANQIAAIYGIAPEEVGGEASNSLTYANEEMRQTTRLHNLRPWMARLENGFSALLPNQQYVRFAADATIRADISTRWNVYQIQRNMGYRSLDEIRALEDEPPLPGGLGMSYGEEGQNGTVDQARALAEITQKLYLGTPEKVVITQEEARDILNSAGAGLGPVPANKDLSAPEDPVSGDLPEDLRRLKTPDDISWTYPG